MQERPSGYILSIDSGTSGCKASLWNEDGLMVNIKTEKLERTFPQENFVEQDPNMIWNRQVSAIKSVIADAGINYSDISSIGITNQRETVIAWDSETGLPLYNAISWMDRRTRSYASDLRGVTKSIIKRKTGLVVDPYFSAMKMKWILRKIAAKKEPKFMERVRMGTVDSWIIWKLTSGRNHVTDYSNASRTMLFNIKDGKWDQELLEIFGIPETVLPEVVDSIDPGIKTDQSVTGKEINIGGIAGDQQASLFGHLALDKGDMKNTYGTGSFLLVNAGDQVPVTKRLISTVAWKARGMKMIYAVEGSSFNTGSLLDWIRDGLKILNNSSESESMAMLSPADHGLYFVPALTGLGAPYWDNKVKGVIFGITPKVTQVEIVRSALESIAFRIRDIVDCVRSETGIGPKELKVDGKPTANNFLMQFQSDILQIPVLRFNNLEMTSAGSAYMAGIAEKMWNIDMLRKHNRIDRKFVPEIEKTASDRYYKGWKRAIKSTLMLYD
ncbi:MAG: FGGY family carbohydrate kinase [Thermoplasmata archaeon]